MNPSKLTEGVHREYEVVPLRSKLPFVSLRALWGLHFSTHRIVFFPDCHKIQCFAMANSDFAVAWFDKPVCSCSSLLQFHCRAGLNMVPWLPVWYFSGLLACTCSKSFNHVESSAAAGLALQRGTVPKLRPRPGSFPSSLCREKKEEQRSWAKTPRKHGKTSFPAKSQTCCK